APRPQPRSARPGRCGPLASGYAPGHLRAQAICRGRNLVAARVLRRHGAGRRNSVRAAPTVASRRARRPGAFPEPRLQRLARHLRAGHLRGVWCLCVPLAISAARAGNVAAARRRMDASARRRVHRGFAADPGPGAPLRSWAARWESPSWARLAPEPIAAAWHMQARPRPRGRRWPPPWRWRSPCLGRPATDSLLPREKRLRRRSGSPVEPPRSSRCALRFWLRWLSGARGRLPPWATALADDRRVAAKKVRRPVRFPDASVVRERLLPSRVLAVQLGPG